MRISPVNASPPPHVPAELADLVSEITHGDALRDIVAGHPVSLDDLGQIKGVGASKLARCGAAVLAIIARPS